MDMAIEMLHLFDAPQVAMPENDKRNRAPRAGTCRRPEGFSGLGFDSVLAKLLERGVSCLLANFVLLHFIANAAHCFNDLLGGLHRPTAIRHSVC